MTVPSTEYNLLMLNYALKRACPVLPPMPYMEIFGFEYSSQGSGCVEHVRNMLEEYNKSEFFTPNQGIEDFFRTFISFRYKYLKKLKRTIINQYLNVSEKQDSKKSIWYENGFSVSLRIATRTHELMILAKDISDYYSTGKPIRTPVICAYVLCSTHSNRVLIKTMRITKEAQFFEDHKNALEQCASGALSKMTGLRHLSTIYHEFIYDYIDPVLESEHILLTLNNTNIQEISTGSLVHSALSFYTGFSDDSIGEHVVIQRPPHDGQYWNSDVMFNNAMMGYGHHELLIHICMNIALVDGYSGSMLVDELQYYRDRNKSV